MLVVDGGQLLETAKMRIILAFRSEGGTVKSFSAIVHFDIYDDDVPIRLSEWSPPLGLPQENVGLYWGGLGMLDPERATKLKSNNLIWYLRGFGLLEEGGSPESLVRSGGEIDIPFGRVDNMENLLR